MPDDFAFACDESNNYQMMKIIGAAELLGYFLLWVNPEAGAFILTSLMAGAIHFHMTAMGDKPEALVLQFSLLVAGLFVFLFDRKPSTGKAKANSSTQHRAGQPRWPPARTAPARAGACAHA